MSDPGPTPPPACCYTGEGVCFMRRLFSDSDDGPPKPESPDEEFYYVFPLAGVGESPMALKRSALACRRALLVLLRASRLDKASV